jgi:hypothetical protein
MLSMAWEPGVIGNFERLSFWAQKNRAELQRLADESSRSPLGRALAAGTLQLRDLAAGAAPIDTGSLRSSHRGELEPYAGGMQGVVFIDPYARNAVTNSKPSFYGEIWAARNFNWFERVADAHGDEVLDRMEQTALSLVEDLWDSL